MKNIFSMIDSYDGMLIETGGNLEALYGANSENSYAKLMTVMEGLGEEM